MSVLLVNAKINGPIGHIFSYITVHRLTLGCASPALSSYPVSSWIGSRVPENVAMRYKIVVRRVQTAERNRPCRMRLARTAVRMRPAARQISSRDQ
jgi:hypothetical protein